MPNGIDESFFNDASPNKREKKELKETKETEIQTFRGRRNESKLKLRHRYGSKEEGGGEF